MVSFRSSGVSQKVRKRPPSPLFLLLAAQRSILSGFMSSHPVFHDFTDAAVAASFRKFPRTRIRASAAPEVVHQHTVVTNGSGGVEDDRIFVVESGRPLLEFNKEDQLERVRFYATALNQLLAVEDLDYDQAGNVVDPETIWTLTDLRDAVSLGYLGMEVVKQ